MTPEQKTEYKKQVKEVMDKYIKDNGLETVSKEIVMQHLQNMYRKLEDSNLIQYGLDYAKFVGFAQQAFIMADLQDHFR